MTKKQAKKINCITSLWFIMDTTKQKDQDYFWGNCFQMYEQIQATREDWSN